MNKLEKPKESVKEVYAACISKVADANLKAKLQACSAEIEQDEEIYDGKGINGKLREFPQKTTVNGNIDIKEMKKVYTYRMVDLKQPGRLFYNRLLNSVQICPFCGIRDVATLDHYLPKTKYATTVVTPINLIPACRDCNSNKDTSDVTVSNEEVWHPYYDDYGNIRWLYAEIIEDNSPVVIFFVDTSACGISMEDTTKIENSFSIFELSKLYGIYAAKELEDIDFLMRNLRKSVGITGVKQQLNMMYESYRCADANSYKTALYEELKENEWYIGEYLSE